MSTSFEKEILMLQNDDPAERRTAAEELMSCDINADVIKALCKLLEDPDKGVRDSASMTLIYNGNSEIPKYVVPHISSLEISVRNLAGEILLRIGENSIPEMVNYLDDANDDDTKFLIDILGLIGSQEPVESIINVLKTNQNDNVILACCEALGNVKYSESLPLLIEFYEKNELYKPTIIESLGKMESKDVLQFIQSKYHVEDELTKFSIIESLGNVGDAETFFFLLSELSNLKGPLVWTIIYSLQLIKERCSLDLPFDESIKNSILYTLLEAEPRFKKAAANLSREFDDKDILNALLQIYGTDPEIDDNIKSAFYQNPAALYSKISPVIKQRPVNLRYLLQLVKEIVDFDGGESLNMLNGIEKRNLIDSYSVCLGDPDEEVRKNAMELLFLTNAESALIFIDNMVEDDNVWNRLKILELIENIFTPKTNEVLRRMVSDPDEMVSNRAVWVLSQRGITDLEIKTNQTL